MACFGFFFAFLPVLPHLLLEQRVSLPVKIFVPKEVTPGCAPAPELNFRVALIQLSGENHSKTLSYGSLYDHYLSFKHLHLQLFVCGDKIHHHGFNSPESLSHQLLSVEVSEKGDQVPGGQRTQTVAGQEQNCQTRAIWRGEEIQDNLLVQQRNLPAFFTDVMRLQMFPERGSRDQAHTMNGKHRPDRGEIKMKSKNYLQYFFSLA